MAEILYKNAGAGAQGAGPEGQAHQDGSAHQNAGAESAKKDEDVIDADFKQV